MPLLTHTRAWQKESDSSSNRLVDSTVSNSSTSVAINAAINEPTKLETWHEKTKFDHVPVTRRKKASKTTSTAKAVVRQLVAPLRRLLVLLLVDDDVDVEDDDGMLRRQLEVCEAGDERLDDDEMQHVQLDSSSSVSGQLFSLSVALAFVEAEVDRVLLLLLLLLVNECVQEAEAAEVESVARNNDMAAAAAVAVAAEVSEQTSDSSTRLVGCCCERQPAMQCQQRHNKQKEKKCVKPIQLQHDIQRKKKRNIKGKQNKTKWK